MDEPELEGMIPDALRPQSAKIVLRGLEVIADIGFHDFEVGQPQRLLVTVELWLDRPEPPQGDDPANAWDYDHVRTQVLELAGERRYNLQESFADVIYRRLASMRGVRALRVTTAKPDIYRDAEAVGVEVASFHGLAP